MINQSQHVIDEKSGVALAKGFLNRTFHTTTGDLFVNANGEKRVDVYACTYDALGNETVKMCGTSGLFSLQHLIPV